jgi:hypothetical protein
MKEQTELSSKTDHPYVIRAHHLQNFTLLFHYNRTKAEYSRELKNAGHVVAAEYGNDIWQGARYDAKKRSDIFGDTAQGSRKFIRRNARLYERFLALPDSYPTHLVEHQRDLICKTCAIGDHCRKYWGDYSTDPGYMDAFIETATNFGKAHALNISSEKVTFINSEPRNSRRIKTSTEVVREILNEWAARNGRYMQAGGILFAYQKR